MNSTDVQDAFRAAILPLGWAWLVMLWQQPGSLHGGVSEQKIAPRNIDIFSDEAAARKRLNEYAVNAEISDSPAVLEIALLAGTSDSDYQHAMQQIMFDVPGTDFQQRVWQGIRQIPKGTTITYQQLASAIGRPSAIRAVASACGRNPLALLVPCHRVVPAGADCSYPGRYRWGDELKPLILGHEIQSL